ncbi:MAG: hypothetical protein QE485_10840 [Acidovorax sp.]|nr:hypothetical protein [Acidovorax sp.]
MTTPPDWSSSDKVYQLHHINCPICIAAGMAPGKRERCPAGQQLWATYQQAGDPPHFTWLRKRPRGRKT